MADNLYACQVTFAQLLNFPLSPVYVWRFVPAKVAGCVLRPAEVLGLTKAKVPRCQVAVKLLLRARNQNRIEPNGMERHGTPNQISLISDGCVPSTIDIDIEKKLSKTRHDSRTICTK